MIWRGVEHPFGPTHVLLLLEVIKCPSMGYDLAWCGASFLSGSRQKCSPYDFCSRRLFGRSSVRQDAGDRQVRGRSGAAVQDYKSFSGMTNVETCLGATTQANVVAWEDRCVAVLEGTHDFSSLVTDLDFYKWKPLGRCAVRARCTVASSRSARVE